MPSSSPRAVRIPDANLRYWLARDLNRSEGEALTDADLAAVTRLRTHDPRAAVADLTGLEYATGLTELRIRLDGLPDLGPLASLTSLTVLDLGGWPNGRLADISVLPLERMTGLTELVLDYHEIADIAPLACLEKLTVLDLSSNEITDLRPLAELTGLTKLSLYGNPVRDVSPLAGLKNLKELNLVHNKVSDLAPLLSDGDSVFHLSGNPLSAESLDQHVPALRARGVRVACSAIRFARRSSSASLRPPLPYAPDRNEREPDRPVDGHDPQERLPAGRVALCTCFLRAAAPHGRIPGNWRTSLRRGTESPCTGGREIGADRKRRRLRNCLACTNPRSS